MSIKRLISKLYKYVDEKHHGEVCFKPLYRLATLNSSERIHSDIHEFPEEKHDEEGERKSFFLRRWILWVWSLLWDGSWFHYPVIPSGPWKTVYGYRRTPRRCMMQLVFLVDILTRPPCSQLP